MKEELLKMAQECLSEEEVKEILKKKFKESIESAIESAFRWGDAEKALKKKINDVMVPYIEKYDFSEYLPKLDTVLTEIVNSDACIENKKILENFKDLSIKQEEKEIKVTDLFEAWIKMCEKKISTTGLEVEFDDGPYYESVGCEMRIEESERPVWSSVHRAVIVFENDHDEELNIEIPISKWDFEKEHTLDNLGCVNIQSLRYLGEFDMLLMRLQRAGTKIIINEMEAGGEICPQEEPEASFS